MVRTRAATKAMITGNETGEGKTVASRKSELPAAPDVSLAASASAPTAPSRPVSTASSRSSATVVAKRLAAEAQHARRLADLEAQEMRRLADMQAQEMRRRLADLEAQQASRLVALERETAELEHRAELAAIEADASQHSSRSSRTNIEKWFSKSMISNPELNKPNVFRLPDHKMSVAPLTEAATAPQTRRAAPTAAAACSDGAEVPHLIKSLEVLINNVNKGNSPAINILPRFDGKSHLDWLSLKKCFENTQASYSAGNNLARLNAALTGAAREAVAALLVSAREPGVVLRALDTRYGRPELVVAHEVAAVRALPRVNGEGKDFAIFASRVRNCVEIIRLLDHSEYLTSPELFQAIISKISPLLRAKWLDYAARYEAGGLSKLENLADFLAHEIDLQSRFGMIPEPTTASYAVDSRRARDNVHVVAENCSNCNSISHNNKLNSSTTAPKSKSCISCQQSHDLIQCDKFASLSVDDRWKLIKKKRVCHRCLKVGWHRLSLCKAKKTCDIDGCAFRHHSLLHNPNYERAAAAHVEVEDGETAAGTPSAAPRAAAPAAAPAARLAPASYYDEPKEILSHTSTSIATETSVQPSFLRPLLKVVAVTVSGPSGTVDTYALLDDGASASFLDLEIAAKLGVCGPERQIRLDCVGGLSKDTTVQYVDFHIKGRHAKETYMIRRARAIKGLGCAARPTIEKSDVSKFSYLSDIKEEFCYDNVKPTIIIGIDNWHLTMSRATRKGSRTQPVAIQTALGWVLFGFGCSKTAPVDTVNHTTVSDPEVVAISDRAILEQLIREQYSIDSIGISKREARSTDDVRAVQILERTARRLPSGRYEVGLLWKTDNLFVPDSSKLALSRFLSLEKKMCRDSNYAERYRQNIHDMIRKGYAELCTEVHTAKSPVWVLPHFGVTNPNKPNKLRLVHDAAAKSQGVSLNSLLLTGPDLLQPLLGILLRFREGKVALTGDIREMFPQVKIRVEDRDAQRFLWRDNPKEPIKTYRMSSMIFGAASSPFTAIYVKNKNAVEWQERYPAAARAIIVDHYMDDCIVSLDSIDEAAKLAAEIYYIHRHAGFEMRAWASNEPSALSLLPKESLVEVPVASHDVDVDLGHLTTPVRTLGLIWQPVADTIGFNTGISKNCALPNKFTKREVLAHVMRVFDPLGILAPVVVTGRIMFQNSWRKGLDWDEELSQNDSVAWRHWFEDLFAASRLQIPRCYCPGELKVDKCELHVFCDASESAYSAVAYWRFIMENGDVKLALICSKVRVAPLKLVSINRLELQGALVAARLASTICEAHRLKPVKRIFWCDSMTVLGWLRSEARLFKSFVSHRVGEIVEITDVKEWRWVPSHLNVADDATRIKRVMLSPESRWISGPEFLLSSEWPTEPCAPEYTDLEECKQSVRPDLVHLISDVAKHEPVSADPERFSSWLRLVRATATAHKYLTLLRMRSLTRRGLCVDNLVRLEGGLCTFMFQPSSQWQQFTAPRSSHGSARDLTATDIRLAETHILLKSQLVSFPSEMTHLNSRPTQLLPRSSRLSKLAVLIGEDRLMRLSGRIKAASHVRRETKSPVVLDGRHPAVRLLVEHHHRRAAHANTETVVNELRQDYYLLSLRSSVRAVAFHCQFCRIRRAVNFQPPTGDLPEARLGHHNRPFTFTALDYFGPVQVSIGRRREKRYVALYTCLVVRAVHLEVVDSLSTDSAMMSLRRFIARRGTPAEIWSDNGTAFVGANRELRRLYAEATAQYATSEKINWRFIPPAAPFMGGSWERLVKSVKVALKVTLTERAPTDEVLRTLLAEAEALVNSRPLTHVTVDDNSEEALTPTHFLLAASSGRPIPATVSDSDFASRSSWRKAVRLADHFWQRWVKEYLPTLIPRRGRGEVPEVAVGDVVLIADPNSPRGTWPRGRVTAVFPGPDGVIRVADVRTLMGIMRRPLRKLVKLLC